MSSKRTAHRRIPRKAKLNPIPRGAHIVTPYLVLDDTSKALAFYKKAFGAKELTREKTPGGKIIHASMKIGDSTVMMADEFPGSYAKSPSALGGSTGSLHIYSKNVDLLWKKAISVGAEIVMPLEDQFWGERYGVVSDPFVHKWTMSMQIPMSRSEKEKKKRMAAMAMFSQGQHPGEPSYLV